MRIPPPVWLGAAALAQWRLARGSRRRPTPASTITSTLLAATSLGVAADAARRFITRGTTLDPLDVEGSTGLVTDGPNALSRNPMYLGLVGLLVAHALYRRSPVALLPVPAFVFVIDRWQIPAEETALAATFGADYDAYRSTVPRWLGYPAKVGVTGPGWPAPR